MPENWVQHPVVNTEEGSNPGAPLAWGSPENPDDVVAGYGYVAADTSEVEETFYYHSDHLGSTSYITDQQANVTQYDAYLPYGELLVDEHSSSADLPYKFNGKELDEETGLYYYGARYMNPVTSMWYGVDAMAEGKTSIGSYVYCMGNPIRMIDPDGNWERNSAGNLVAQKGDNAVTLGKYLGIDKHEALGILTSNGVTINENNILNLSIGQEIKSSYLQGVTITGSMKQTQKFQANSKSNVANMHISEKGIEFLKAVEGVEHYPYPDIKGHATIGVGHLMHFGAPTAKELNTYYSDDDINKLLAKDLQKYEDLIHSTVKVPLTQNQFDALISFAWNIGPGYVKKSSKSKPGFRQSEMLRQLNLGVYDGKLFYEWLKPIQLKGRRTKEQILFDKGKY